MTTPAEGKTLWPSRGFAAALFALLAIETAAILALSAEGRHSITSPDGVVYNRFATNLVDHGAFSAATSAPFEPSVYRTPGYPLFLAALRLIGGDSLLLVRVVQFLLLGLTAVLVYAAARRLFDVATARVAGVLTVTYLPFLWIARLHLTETVTSLLLTAIVVLLLIGRRTWHFAAIGALLGCAAMVRPLFAFAVVPILLGMLIWPQTGRREAAKHAAVVLAALCVLLVPWTIRNYNVTDEFSPLGGGGGGTSLLASAMQYQNTLQYRFDAAELHILDAKEQPIVRRAEAQARRESGPPTQNIREELAADRAVRKEARRIFKSLTLSDVLREIPQREAYLWAVQDYPPEASLTFWHRIAQLQHFLLFALALFGLFIGLRRVGTSIWPLLVFPAFLMVAHLVVHSEGRYSIPARPTVLVLSSLAAVFIWRRFVARDRSAPPSRMHAESDLPARS
jgi:4-amino-4-deoxy-L-arabinose transferase-like glycosyltransferase